MDPEFSITTDLAVVLLAEADSIISSNLIVEVVVKVVVEVAEVDSFAAVAAKSNISLIDHHRIEVEEDPVADNSEVAGLG